MRRLWVVVLACALVPLVGCSDEDPKAEPQPGPTASESVSATPKNESAEDFIRRWNDSLNEAQAGRPGEWGELTQDCARCQETTDLFAGIYRDGGYVKTEGREIVKVRQASGERLPHTYRITTKSPPTQFKRSSSAPEERLEGGEGVFYARLEGTPGAWILADIWQEPR